MCYVLEVSSLPMCFKLAVEHMMMIMISILNLNEMLKNGN